VIKREEGDVPDFSLEKARKFFSEVCAYVEKVILEFMIDTLAAEAGRFLHTAPSALPDTFVPAFAPSSLQGHLQWVRHPPDGHTSIEGAHV